MKALNKQAYRADGGDIGTGRLKAIADNVYGDEEKRWLAQRVLALLDELEHYKSREDRVTKLVLDNSTSWNKVYKKLEAAEKRIAELEARTVTLPPQAPENLALVLDGYEKWLIATTFRDTWNACLAEVTRMNAAGIGVKGD